MKRQNHLTSQSYYQTNGLEDGELFSSDNEILRKSVLPLLAKRAKGVTLYAGWSPTLKFTPPAAERFVVVDFADRVLRNLPKRPNMNAVCAAVEALPFESYSFDTVFMTGLLHHLTEDSAIESDSVIHRTMGEIARMMRRDAKLYIVEPFVSPFLEVVNRTLYFTMRAYMNGRGLPMMCFYSIPNLKMLLDESGLELLYATPIGIGGAVPVSWFLPSRKIQYKYLPQKISLLEVKKKSAV